MQEAEIRRIVVQSQVVCKILSRKNPSQRRVGGLAKGVGPKFKSQYRKKKKKKEGYYEKCLGRMIIITSARINETIK
jgi:hypothetical protein